MNVHKPSIDGVIKKHLQIDFEDLEKELKKLKEQLADSKDQQLINEGELLDAFYRELIWPDKIKGKDEFFRNITIIGNIESEIGIIKNKIDIAGMQSSTNSQSNKVSKFFMDPIKKVIQNISQRLWQCLSLIMNLDSWSVAGHAQVSLFGLGSGVTLQLNLK